jgi:hypothetical protein
MSAAPDPAELTAPKDPAAYRRRPGLGGWAVAALCVLCILAGIALGRSLPGLFDARRAVLSPSLPTLEPAEPPVQPPAASPAPAPSEGADLARLAARVSALEGQERSANRAAASALAAAALVEASQGSRPFSEEFTALRAAAPDLSESAALARLAETGAPTRAALAASFPDYAARAATAARTPAEGAGLGERIGYALSRIVTVRRVAETTGDGVDARLARAERLAEDGDLDGALRVLDGLPQAAREAVAPWRLRAERRAEIDRQAAALRARALRALAETPEPTP